MCGKPRVFVSNGIKNFLNDQIIPMLKKNGNNLLEKYKMEQNSNEYVSMQNKS